MSWHLCIRLNNPGYKAALSGGVQKCIWTPLRGSLVTSGDIYTPVLISGYFWTTLMFYPLWSDWRVTQTQLSVFQIKLKHPFSILSKQRNKQINLIVIKGLYELCHPFSPMPAPGGYFLVKGYWRCTTGWGCIFTTGLTIMGLHF